MSQRNGKFSTYKKKMAYIKVKTTLRIRVYSKTILLYIETAYSTAYSTTTVPMVCKSYQINFSLFPQKTDPNTKARSSMKREKKI